jgi:hypothetical protein
MGGSGSGNFHHWYRPEKKPVVEDSLSFDINDWQRRGFVREGNTYQGMTRWTYANGQSFAVSYQVDTREPGGSFVLFSYQWVWRRTGNSDSASYRVRLTTSELHRGGRRWWFGSEQFRGAGQVAATGFVLQKGSATDLFPTGKVRYYTSSPSGRVRRRELRGPAPARPLSERIVPMASLFRPTYTHTDKATGEKTLRRAKKWYGQYTDADGVLRRMPLSANKSAAQQMLNALVTKSELGKIGISDPFETHRKRPLDEHLNDFEADLKAKGNTGKQVKLKVGRIRRLLSSCRSCS